MKEVATIRKAKRGRGRGGRGEKEERTWKRKRCVRRQRSIETTRRRTDKKREK